MKILAYFVYAILLSVIVLRTETDRVDRSNNAYIVLRNLPANRLLRSGDISPMPQGLVYARSELHAFERVGVADFAALPTIRSPEKTLPLALPVATGDKLRINAGDRVWLCAHDSETASDIQVIAEICEARDGECIAIVALPQGLAEATSSSMTTGIPAVQSKTCK